MDARWLGTVPYDEALALQDALVESRRREESGDILLLLEHPPVVTLGRGSRPEHVLAHDAERRSLGIELRECGRGGDVTFHGPGQLVGYPILALPEGRRDAHRYLRDLEEALILLSSDYGVLGTRIAGRTGVWVGTRKLAAIGVRISRGWITSHGFAFNVHTDLSGFRTIVPCGIRDAGVTSLLDLTGERFEVQDVATRAARRVRETLGGTSLVPHSSDELARWNEARLS